MARPAKLLCELEGSPLFAPDFPRRPRFTHAEWAANPEVALKESLAFGVTAIRRLADAKALRDLVWKIGDAKFAPALPVLAKLWSDCAVDPVRHAAGRALRIMGTAEARAVLTAFLRGFWEIVGGIDFIWNCERDDRARDFGLGVALAEMDPLAVDPPGTAPHFFEKWEDGRSAIDPELNDPFILHLAPDGLHKANISGGEPYGIALPFLGADPLFLGEEHKLPFLDYLRLVCRWGGFPRLERHAENPAVRDFVDLEPF